MGLGKARSLQQENKVSPNLETARRGIYGFTQLLGFATWILTFLTYFLTDVASPAIALWLLAGFLLWLGARSISTQSISNSIQFISLTLILGTPLIFESANQDRWIPITVVALALVAILAFQIENWFVFLAIPAFISIIKFLIDLDLMSYLYGGAVYKSGLMSILYLMVVGITTWVMKRITLNQAKEFDLKIVDFAAELDSVRRDQINREINQSIARRLHESILNTFTAIARIRDTSLLSDIKKVVRRDLEALEQISNEIRPIALADLIEEALFRTTLDRNLITILPGGEVEVSVITYTPLVESVTEALRNVERHSRANQITISWEILGGYVLLKLSDNGIGFDHNQVNSNSFGLRVINHQDLISLGHQVEIESKKDIGTEIRWKLTEFKPKQNNIPSSANWPKLTEDNLAFRFLFLIVPVFIASFVHMLSQEFANSTQVTLLFFGYVAVLAIYAGIQQAKLRLMTLPVLLSLILWGQLNLINQTGNCVDALPIQWIMNGYTVGVLLILLSAIPIWSKIAILIGNFFAIALVATSLGKCQEIALLPGITGVLVAVGLIFGLNKLRQTNIQTMLDLEKSINTSLELQHRQDATDRAHLRLRVVTKDARELLESLLTAENDSDFREFQTRCKMQESYLRSALLIIQTMRIDTQQNLLDILSKLAKNGVQVSIESWTENLNYIIWPDPVIEFGYKFAESFKDGSCKLMFFEENDQIILVFEAHGKTESSYADYDFIETLTADHLRLREAIGLITDKSPQIEIPPQQSSALR
jgi:signal transduction histidine kinase